MTHLELPVFTSTAAKLWAKVSAEDKKASLENVYCGQCKGTTTMFNAVARLSVARRVFEAGGAVC